MVTKEEIDAFVDFCRGADDIRVTSATWGRVVPALADENDRLRKENDRLEALFQQAHGVHSSWVAYRIENATLRAQFAEAVALLERSPMLYRCIAGSMGQDFCDSRDGAICSDHARRVFLAKLRGAL